MFVRPVLLNVNMVVQVQLIIVALCVMTRNFWILALRIVFSALKAALSVLDLMIVIVL